MWIYTRPLNARCRVPRIRSTGRFQHTHIQSSISITRSRKHAHSSRKHGTTCGSAGCCDGSKAPVQHPERDLENGMRVLIKLTDRFESSVHDSYLLGAKLRLPAEVLERDRYRFRHAGRLDLIHHLLGGAVRRRRHL